MAVAGKSAKELRYLRQTTAETPSNLYSPLGYACTPLLQGKQIGHVCSQIAQRHCEFSGRCAASIGYGVHVYPDRTASVALQYQCTPLPSERQSHSRPPHIYSSGLIYYTQPMHGSKHLGEVFERCMDTTDAESRMSSHPVFIPLLSPAVKC